jgi:hypothetical protein
MIAADKIVHFLPGAAIAAGVGAVLHPVAGLAACAVAAWAKEAWDARRPDTRTTDGWDAYATLCGAVPAMALLHFL